MAMVEAARAMRTVLIPAAIIQELSERKQLEVEAVSVTEKVASTGGKVKQRITLLREISFL